MIIKKITLIFLAVCTALTFTGCSSLFSSADTPGATPEDEKPKIHFTASPDNGEAAGSPAASGAFDPEVSEEPEPEPPPAKTPVPPVPDEEKGAGPDLSALADEINGQLQEYGKDCIWDIWVECLPDGNGIRCTNDEDASSMVSASLIKLFIMAAVYEQVSLGNLAESDVEDSMKKMITVSDNYAANELTNLLGGGSSNNGMDAVNAYSYDIGCSNSNIARLMLAAVKLSFHHPFTGGRAEIFCPPEESFLSVARALGWEEAALRNPESGLR
jgi:hypothetical protein